MINKLDNHHPHKIPQPPDQTQLLAEIQAAREILAAVASAGTRYPGSLLSDCIAVQRKAALHLLKFPDKTLQTERTNL